MKTVLLTGATGLIGSHVLYELIKMSWETDEQLLIITPIRPSPGISANERIQNILSGASTPIFLREKQKQAKIEVIETDLADIDSASAIHSCIGDREDVHVVHAAGSTNLLHGEDALAEIQRNNLRATRNLIAGCDGKMKAFSYISTAFSCGIKGGTITDEMLENTTTNFRNPYEQVKASIEREIAAICSQKEITFQMLRPSVVCGRLIDEQLYFTPKFDVFYAFARFVAMIKRSKHSMPLRIAINPSGGLNIVPVDYVAKAIVAAIANPIRELNIVHSQCLSNSLLVNMICSLSEFDDFHLVDSVPNKQNKLERLYYDSVGAALTPYVMAPAYQYATGKLRGILPSIREPNIKKHFPGLIEFGQKCGFRSA